MRKGNEEKGGKRKEPLNDFQRIFSHILAEAVAQGRTTKEKCWDAELSIVFPPQPDLCDIVGYARTLDGKDVLIQYPSGSFDQIFVDEWKGFKSAQALSGLRQVFNRTAEDLGAHVRLYALGMPRRSCDITGGLVTAFEVYNLLVDLTPQLQPTVKYGSTEMGIGKPDFLYLDGAHLGFLNWGRSQSSDSISTTVDYVGRDYDELLALRRKVYAEPAVEVMVDK